MTEQNLEKHLSISEGIEKNNFFCDSTNKKIGFSRLPQSIEEAQFYSDFWSLIVDYFPDKIKELTFYYEEKPIKVPLTKLEKFRNYFGANINPKEIPGEVREYITKPILVNNEKNLLKIITSEKEFSSLVKVSENTQDVKTRYVMTLEPLCYNSFVPRELIKEIKLKEGI